MSLFVPEEEENEVFHDTVEKNGGDISDDDEVISEIPIYLSTKVDNLSVLQFPNRTKEARVISSKMKSESGVIEIETPLDTTKFFDAEKSADWGNVETHSLTGVLKENDIYYIGVLKDNAITLTPIKSTAQLRPSLKYIDEASLSKKQKQQLFTKLVEDESKKEIKVVQMTVKSTNESSQPRLGGALQLSKKLDDEHYVNYKWIDSDDINEDIRGKLYHNDDDEILISDTTEQEYINWLFSETKL